MQGTVKGIKKYSNQIEDADARDTFLFIWFLLVMLCVVHGRRMACCRDGRAIFGLTRGINRPEAIRRCEVFKMTDGLRLLRFSAICFCAGSRLVF